MLLLHDRLHVPSYESDVTALFTAAVAQESSSFAAAVAVGNLTTAWPAAVASRLSFAATPDQVQQEQWWWYFQNHAAHTRPAACSLLLASLQPQQHSHSHLPTSVYP